LIIKINAEIGCWLWKNFWGQGLAQEAIELMLNFAFKDLKLKRIWAKVVHLNKRSQILLRRTGFKYEGRLRKIHLEMGNGWMI
jgi:RimJ/RimL family protein N-acetyltransferase